MAKIFSCSILFVSFSTCVCALRRHRMHTEVTCSPVWGQCGGRTWNGAKCCVEGSECIESNEWYSQCQQSSNVNPTPRPTPMPITIPTVTPTPLPSSAPTPMPMPAHGSNCTCARSTTWDGSFGQFTDGKSFCQQNFGGMNPYISGGGGDGNNGGWSGPGPCTAGQYSFCDHHGWLINVDKTQGEGKAPYRAFAYTQFCNGRPYSACWHGKEKVTFSFSFKVAGLHDIAAYIKLLFWTDSGNIIGLLPPKHPKSSGSLQLVTFIRDDYPNGWSNEVAIQEQTWYHVRIDFLPASSGVRVFLDGSIVADGTIPVDMLSASNGPQIGVYGFDFSRKTWPDGGFALWINQPCVGEASAGCISQK